MNEFLYSTLKKQLIEAGFEKEIDWQTTLKPCTEANIFRDEAIWVILNSGMREQVARVIRNRIWKAIHENRDISEVFGHKGKVSAIKTILQSYEEMFVAYLRAQDKLEYLQTIPFIGGITKYHLAKNLGHNCIKPDRHLVRIAKQHGIENCNTMCETLSAATGDKVSVVDIVLWRSANLGWI